MRSVDLELSLRGQWSAAILITNRGSKCWPACEGSGPAFLGLEGFPHARRFWSPMSVTCQQLSRDQTCPEFCDI